MRMIELCNKIDLCDYCDKKAEYNWFRKNLFSIKMRVLCKEHRLMKEELK